MFDDAEADAAVAAIARGEFDFQEHGACRERPDLNFFPPKGANWKTYKALTDCCAGCPVLDDCREWGLRFEHYGVWGGLTERGRQMERKARELAAARNDRMAA
jgi:hypothetical protein